MKGPSRWQPLVLSACCLMACARLGQPRVDQGFEEALKNFEPLRQQPAVWNDHPRPARVAVSGIAALETGAADEARSSAEKALQEWVREYLEGVPFEVKDDAIRMGQELVGPDGTSDKESLPVLLEGTETLPSVALCKVHTEIDLPELKWPDLSVRILAVGRAEIGKGTMQNAYREARYDAFRNALQLWLSESKREMKRQLDWNVRRNQELDAMEEELEKLGKELDETYQRYLESLKTFEKKAGAEPDGGKNSGGTEGVETRENTGGGDNSEGSGTGDGAKSADFKENGEGSEAGKGEKNAAGSISTTPATLPETGSAPPETPAVRAMTEEEMLAELENWVPPPTSGRVLMEGLYYESIDGPEDVTPKDGVYKVIVGVEIRPRSTDWER